MAGDKRTLKPGLLPEILLNLKPALKILGIVGMMDEEIISAQYAFLLTIVHYFL